MKRGLLSQPQRIGERIASRNLLNINHPLAESSPVARIPISMIPGVGGIASGYMQEDLATLKQPEETFFNIPSSPDGTRDPRYFPLPGGVNITNHDLARFGLATDAMDWIPGAAAVGSMATGAGLLGRWLKGNETPDSDAVSLWDAISPAMVDPRTGLLSMTGYHGTPHRFPPTETNPLGEFDLQKIGTGEGAQAYGHGIYVAEHPDTAKTYMPRDHDAEEKMMAKYEEAEGRGDYASMEIWENAMMHDTSSEIRKRYDDPDYDDDMREIANEIADELELIEESSASALYEVDIPDEVIDNQMLDWDAPLSEQSEAVRRALEGFKLPRDQLEPGRQAGQTGWQLYDKETGYLVSNYSFSSEKEVMDFLENPTGSDIYNLLSGGNDTAMAAEVSSSLRSKGISGIKYKDAASRGGEGGTRNFVLFDPTVATITGRN
jgi:hypothetical protein